ncbi:qutD [Cyberlindnera jadinii]|uniref:QutD protein n=1 Tax=Cyberlindnera jadinii (strain ATCC 18201 / CBS 1600 / BCRC 20928 / JCM 3617 / NBRC 0987 / NRRL Y-1542) TaxID=983966 RepID=A0A0H5C4C5_CYBJN|nr:qutD [Cyberlindnera jadinii]
MQSIKQFFAKFYSTEGVPSEIFNKTLYFAIFVFGILGCGRGYDEGYIGGVVSKQPFIDTFGLDNPSWSESYEANVESNITSMVILGSIGGSLFAMYFIDRFGRVRTLQGSLILWIVAVIIEITSTDLGQLYAGRLIEGLAIGQTVVIGPCYLSEIAPKNIRGLANCIFAGAVYFGSFMSNFINYGCSLHIDTNSQKQWIIPTAIKIVVAGLLFIGSLFCFESPRWLAKKGQEEKASIALSKIRNLPTDHPYVLSELSDIQEQISVEILEHGKMTKFGAFKELFTIKSLRYRILLALSAQILGQWSFAGSITVYMTELVSLVGVTGTRRVFYSAILGVVKFSSAYIGAFFVIDILGRKKALLMGITIQLIATLYFAIYLQIVPQATENNIQLTDSQSRAGVAALASLFITGVGWTLGWNSIQYLINSEMLPIHVRHIGTALIMIFHFANQYGNTKALPSMLIYLTPAGTFFFASAILVIGLFWAWFLLPEIAGRSLESMEELFNLPWYLIGRKGAQLCPDHSGIAHIKQNGEITEMNIKSEQEFVEEVSNYSGNSSSNNQKNVDLEKGAH